MYEIEQCGNCGEDDDGEMSSASGPSRDPNGAHDVFHKGCLPEGWTWD